jgi:2-polyprenyl-3-methyl-5-hydroxy-6-metoxy-1,4-benzoquinol methylase
MIRQPQTKNSSELWDEIWSDTALDRREILYTIEKEKRDSLWKQIKRAVLDKYGTFKDLQIVELGGGAGTYAVLMAQEGAKVTILDYSKNAISRSQNFFESLHLKAEFVLCDALHLKSSFLNKYDVSMSFGLAEHFLHAERLQIVHSHFDLLTAGGVTFISVPNKYCLPYRLWKMKRELQGNWAYGEEYPFSRQEFSKICTSLQIKSHSFLGSSFVASLDFILPFSTWRNSLQKRLWPTAYDPLKLANIRHRERHFIDQYIGYALVLYAEI